MMNNNNNNNNNDDDDDEEEEEEQQQQGDAEGLDEEQQHRLQIAEEHAVWKKNSPLLYDWVSTYALEWPSLTVQWLPDVVKSARRDDFNTHRLLIGTNTSDQEPNYLMIAEVDLPSLDVEIDVRSRPDGSDVLSSRFDKGLDIKTRILHDGEVNRARYMPQNTNLIATKSPSSTVYVFDVSKHGPHPVDNTTINPQHRCLGHSQEGYGLSWSPTVAAQLLSGSNDSSICIWDLKEAGLEVQPLRKILNAHSGTVEDVDWHKQYDFLFAAVGDDHHVTLWDTRQPCTSPSNRVENAHNGDVHCLAFNAFSEFLLATGGADKCVSLWDLRNITERVHSFEGHDEEIMMVSWAPFSDTTFASCSADRRVNIWDVSKVGEEQSPEDAEDGPPELIFSHGGHTSRVSDFSWNANDQWVIASVEEDNSLQVWQLASAILGDDEEADEDDEDLEEQPTKKQKGE